MVIDLVGLVEDGSAFATGVARNPRREIGVAQGQDVTIQVKVQTPAGQTVVLTGGSAVLTVKKHPADDTTLISKAAVISGDTATFTLAAADTKPSRMDSGRYTYDVWLTMGGKRDPVVPASGFVLYPAVAPVP